MRSPVAQPAEAGRPRSLPAWTDFAVHPSLGATKDTARRPRGSLVTVTSPRLGPRHTGNSPRCSARIVLEDIVLNGNAPRANGSVKLRHCKHCIVKYREPAMRDLAGTPTNLGLTIETVSREISKLKRARLISMRGPHKIALRSVRTLRDIAGIDDDERPKDPPSQGGLAAWADDRSGCLRGDAAA